MLEGYSTTAAAETTESLLGRAKAQAVLAVPLGANHLLLTATLFHSQHQMIYRTAPTTVSEAYY
jgi:hypothetical protein